MGGYFFFRMGSRSIDNHCNLTIILFCLLYLRTKNTFDFAAASGIKSSGLKSSLATGLSHSALRRLSLRNGPFRILRLLAHPHGPPPHPPPPPLPLPFFIPRQPIKQMNALTASAIRFINFSIFCFFLVTARCDHSRVNGTEKQKKRTHLWRMIRFRIVWIMLSNQWTFRWKHSAGLWK